MFTVLAPGQGSQLPRMLVPWLRNPRIRGVLGRWSQAAGIDLDYLGARAPADVIARTENTQPLLVTAGLLPLVAMERADRLALHGSSIIVAGHSLGELTAAVVAGVLSAADAVRLAAVRGAAMAAACEMAPTGMAAVVGGVQTAVLAHLADLGLEPATFNGQGQIVAAGPADRLDRLKAHPLPGTSVQPLSVAGAFHTSAMAPAAERLRTAAAATEFRDPRTVLLSNRDGRVVRTGSEFRDLFVQQLTRPVRWDLTLDALDRTGSTLRLAVTLPPARTLTSMLRRRLPSALVTPIGVPRDVRTTLVAAGAATRTATRLAVA